MNLHQWVLMLTRYELLLGVLFLEVELDAKLVVLLVYYMLLLMVNMLALWMIAVMKEPTTISMQKKLDEDVFFYFLV
jgi:hypothetical protein